MVRASSEIRIGSRIDTPATTFPLKLPVRSRERALGNTLPLQLAPPGSNGKFGFNSYTNDTEFS